MIRLRSKQQWIWLPVLLAVFLLSACSAPSAQTDAPPEPAGIPVEASDAPVSEPASAPTLPPESPSSSPEDSAPVDDVEPVAEEDDEIFYPENQTVDTCLVGTWAVDHDSMSEYLAIAMNQGDLNLFTIAQIDGELYMAFTEDGQMSMSSDNFVTQVELNSAGMNFKITIELKASGTAQYQADGQSITNWNRDYESTGRPMDGIFSVVSGGGSNFVVDITPDWFIYGIQEVSGTAENIAQYVCSGDTLSLTPSDFGPIVFNRVD